jgi:hypothetical protein
MKTTTTKPTEAASALIVTLLVVFLIVVSIGIAMNMTTNTLKVTDSSKDFSALRSAAEGAVDFGYGVWNKTANSYYAPPTSAHLATALNIVPTFNGFTYASTSDGPLKVTSIDGYGQPSSASTPVYTLINLDNYPGWTGTNYSYMASVRMSGTSAGGRTITYGVKRTINYEVVPLFQATAFFEGDLELYRAATMTIGGLVHTNSKAYVSSSNAGTLTFSGHLSYSADGGYLPDVDPPQSSTWSGWSPNSELPPTFSNGGASLQVDEVSRMEPLGADSAALLHPPKNPNGTSTGDANPNDDSIRELIEPPKNTAAYPDPTPIASRRLYNKAGIIIHMEPVTTTVTTGWGSHQTTTTTTTITPTITTPAQNGTTLTPSQKTALINALSTDDRIYDFREGQNVAITTLDIGAAKATLNAASGFNNIIYIDQTDANGNISGNAEQGIRLKNGASLPSDGLTIASQNPVYIQGDYNTTNANTRGSAAVFADAVTILSNSWNDSNSNKSLNYRSASNTTVNTAIVAGFVPSGWTNFNSVPAYGYSGGLNNFPRFLESWTNRTFTYNGSMIALFTSEVATGQWDTGNIYVPPNRVWDFDSNFLTKPPPGSLDAVYIGRGAFARF